MTKSSKSSNKKAKHSKSAGMGFLLILVSSAIVATILAFLSTNQSTAVPTNTGTARASVLFVGDSNIILNKSLMSYMTFDNGKINYPYTPIIIARAGGRIRTPDCAVTTNCTTYNWWQPRIVNEIARGKPSAVVVNLGINDAISEGTSEFTPGYGYYGKKIDWLMGLIPTTIPVFWTNLPCQLEPANLLEACGKINQQLTWAAGRHANFKLIDWRSYAHSKSIKSDGTYNKDLYMLPGQVHYNDAGYAEWNKLVISKLDTQFPLN